MKASNEDAGIISNARLNETFVIVNGILISTFLVLAVIVIAKVSKELKFNAYYSMMIVLVAIGLRFMLSILMINGVL